MGPRAQLEQALRASFAREDLAVYADLLLAEGDPRGELIALDLDPHPTPAWQARRREVIEGWLGHAVASVSHHLIRLGFIPELGDGNAGLAVLASPAGAYVRAFRTRGDTRTLRVALAKLAAAPRPWLAQLTIERWSAEGEICIGQALVDELIIQTPALTGLAIAGSRVVHGFSHPGVTALRVSGFDAIATWSPMPAVARLDLASTATIPAWSARVVGGDAPAVPLDAAMLPALTHLDLSRDEPRDDDPARIWDALRDWPIRTQITHLDLPAFDAEDAPRLARTLDAMPALVEVRVARIYGDHGDELRARTPPVAIPPRTPWPRDHTLRAPDALTVLVADLDVRVDVDLRSIVRYLETTERVRALGARAAWTRFWDTVAELAGHDPAPFPFAVLDEALAACSDDIEDEAPRWAELRHQLRIARDRVAAAATVQLQRYWLV